MAERDPETIKRDIDRARRQLASTVDIIAGRANPQLLAEQAKSRVLRFVTQPGVVISLVGLGGLAVLLMVRRVRHR